MTTSEVVEVALTMNVLVNDCNDGTPHAGPSYSTFDIHPAGAAKTLTKLPADIDVRAGKATMTFQVLASRGNFIVDWTSVHDGCYSANGHQNYRVVAPTGPAFTDVPAGAFYETAVAWLANQGITTGTSPTTFSPDDPVTRGQMATFLHRYDGQPAVA